MSSPRCECGSFLPPPATCGKCGRLAYPEGQDVALAVELLDYAHELLDALDSATALKARDAVGWAAFNLRRA